MYNEDSLEVQREHQVHPGGDAEDHADALKNLQTRAKVPPQSSFGPGFQQWATNGQLTKYLMRAPWFLPLLLLAASSDP